MGQPLPLSILVGGSDSVAMDDGCFFIGMMEVRMDKLYEMKAWQNFESYTHVFVEL